MYLEMVEVCFWHDEWWDIVLKELFPDSFLIVEEKDVFVHSCLDFSEDGRVRSQNLRLIVAINRNPSSNSMKYICKHIFFIIFIHKTMKL